MNMNVQKKTKYIAALAIGCLALATSATAQNRVAGETPGSTGSQTSVTRPPFYSSEVPGSTGTGTTRPPYYSSEVPGSTSTGGTRPVYFESSTPGATGTSFTRPNYAVGVSPVVPDNPVIQIGLHPNPARETFYIEITGIGQRDEVEVYIFSARGSRLSAPMERAGQTIRVSVSNLPRGSYFVQVIANGVERTQSIELI